MTRVSSFALLSCLLLLALGVSAAERKIDSRDWPHWRGPNLNGIAADQQAPLTWSETENVVWKSPIPGRGHSSPVVVGNRIFLTTADEQEKIQSVLCYDRAGGQQRWKVDLHRGGFDPKAHRKNTQASSTIACDGQRLFVTFLNDGAIWLTALDLDGKQIWQRKAGDFVSHWGYSASPAIYKSLVIVAADHKEGGYLTALDRETGEVRWTTPRPAEPNYPSPVIFHLAGKDQLLIAGCDLVASYDPNTGKELWTCPGTTTECVGTMVAEGDLVFASGGYPGKETICVRADGSAEVVWRNNQQVYVPSLLAHNGHVYTMADNGIAICWKADTGEEAWKARVGGVFSASPILVGDRIYVPSEEGKTVVFQANPDKFTLLAENQLGNEIFATPVVCGGQLFLRVADDVDGRRQESLYCIGQPSDESGK